MEVYLGFRAGKTNGNPPIIWNSKNVINPHICIIGMTGSGKSFTLRKLINSLALSSSLPEHKIHTFDVHGDLNIESNSSVLFSEQTPYGLNPLKFSSDPNFGGIRKKTNSFISVLKKYTRALGEKQIAVIRNLLYDTYDRFGFKVNDPTTWQIEESDDFSLGEKFYIKVPIQEKADAVKLGVFWDPRKRAWWIDAQNYTGAITRWPPNPDVRIYPALIDVLQYARHMNQCVFLGTNSEVCSKLEIARRTSNQFLKKRLKTQDQDNVEKAKLKAIEAYTDYVNSIITGEEIEQLMKYDSSDVLMTVVDRLENLNAMGIFKPEQPPFDNDSKIWRYDLRALNSEERCMFIHYRCQEIFDKALRRGQTNEIHDTIVIDEAHMVLDDEPDNIIRTIALEGRKFGVQLILASQSPEHYPKDVMTALATKIILGIDELLWRVATSKMNITQEALKWIIIQKRFLVQIKSKGESPIQWYYTYIDKTN
jgi:hypothetical protein